MKRFENKVAVVTGGASGIGEAAIRAFFAEGAKVVIADFSERGADLAAELNEVRPDSSLFIKTDVTNEEQTIAMVEKTVAAFGSLDVMFANAGIARDNDIDKLSLEQWNATIDINLTGVFLSDKYAIEQMMKQETGGTIVNCGSIHSIVGKRGVTAYASAKGGVKLLTQTLGATYAPNKIRINAVGPGYIDTPLIHGATGTAREALTSLHPIGRLGTPEEVANAVLFLASDDASFISGALLPVDGGYTAV